MTTKVELLRGDGKPDLTLEPFFRGREEAKLIRLLQSVPERRKYSVFFERFGCFRCQRRDFPHACHALCSKCYAWARREFDNIRKEIERGEA
jgi:uncharacterized Fe-S cluster-containing radical SAM superfamily protein